MGVSGGACLPWLLRGRPRLPLSAHGGCSAPSALSEPRTSGRAAVQPCSRAASRAVTVARPFWCGVSSTSEWALSCAAEADAVCICGIQTTTAVATAAQSRTSLSSSFPFPPSAPPLPPRHRPDAPFRAPVTRPDPLVSHLIPCRAPASVVLFVPRLSSLGLPDLAPTPLCRRQAVLSTRIVATLIIATLLLIRETSQTALSLPTSSAAVVQLASRLSDSRLKGRLLLPRSCGRGFPPLEGFS